MLCKPCFGFLVAIDADHFSFDADHFSLLKIDLYVSYKYKYGRLYVRNAACGFLEMTLEDPTVQCPVM